MSRRQGHKVNGLQFKRDMILGNWGLRDGGHIQKSGWVYLSCKCSEKVNDKTLVIPNI